MATRKVVFVHGLDCSDDESENCCEGYEFGVSPEQEKVLRDALPDSKPIENWPLTARETLELMYESGEARPKEAKASAKLIST